jgi:hypothetical protein
MATSVSFPLRPGKPPVEFRFTTKFARQMERAGGAGINYIIAAGRSVDALVLATCYGLKHKMPKMTEDLAVDWIDEFIEAGGSTKDLSEAVYKALNLSGVYGPNETKPSDADGGEVAEADPTHSTTTAARSSDGSTGPSPSPSDTSA